MEYKICEKCEAKLHARTLRCPNCNTILTDASKIVSDSEKTIKNEDNNLGNEIDIKIGDPIAESQESEKETNQKDIKDYVYKAEVRHSLEYTEPLSNFLKVILTAFSTIPIFGQFIGMFFGIFFSTYDDSDRSSFGRALIILSIVTFIFYIYNFMMFSEILANGELSNYLNNFVK